MKERNLTRNLWLLLLIIKKQRENLIIKLKEVLERSLKNQN